MHETSIPKPRYKLGRRTGARTARVSRRLWVCAALLLAGCSVLPQPAVQLVHYDLGLPPPGTSLAPQQRRATLVLAEVRAPGLPELGAAIFYRLAYANAQQLHPYQQSRWSQPVAQLLGLRLRSQLARQRTVLAASHAPAVRATGQALALLRVEVEAFSQVFDAPDVSAAVVQLRATLVASDAHPVQKLFDVRQPALTPDAAGAAQALAAASAEAIAQIDDWLTQLGR